MLLVLLVPRCLLRCRCILTVLRLSALARLLRWLCFDCRLLLLWLFCTVRVPHGAAHGARQAQLKRQGVQRSREGATAAMAHQRRVLPWGHHHTLHLTAWLPLLH